MAKKSGKGLRKTPGKMLREAREAHIRSFGVGATGKNGKAIYSLIVGIEKKFRRGHDPLRLHHRHTLPPGYENQGPVQDYVTPILEILSHYDRSLMEGVGKITEAGGRRDYSMRDLDSFIEERQQTISELGIKEGTLDMDYLSYFLVGKNEMDGSKNDLIEGAKIRERNLLGSAGDFEKTRVNRKERAPWLGEARQDYHGSYNE